MLCCKLIQVAIIVLSKRELGNAHCKVSIIVSKFKTSSSCSDWLACRSKQLTGWLPRSFLSVLPACGKHASVSSHGNHSGDTFGGIVAHIFEPVLESYPSLLWRVCSYMSMLQDMKWQSLIKLSAKKPSFSRWVSNQRLVSYKWRTLLAI